MENDVKEFLSELLKQLKSIDYIKPEDIPNIDLYMDQVTTFMDEQLAASKRYESDKILTKTMINNYAKNNLLPSPDKKKYSKEHVLTLLFIYYFKNILSINDIRSILNPLTEKYFGNDDGFTMQDVYLPQRRSGICRHDGRTLCRISPSVLWRLQSRRRRRPHRGCGPGSRL